LLSFFFFFQAEDGIRDYKVTGVQTCALPILRRVRARADERVRDLGRVPLRLDRATHFRDGPVEIGRERADEVRLQLVEVDLDDEIGRASCRERVEMWGGAGAVK